MRRAAVGRRRRRAERRGILTRDRCGVASGRGNRVNWRLCRTPSTLSKRSPNFAPCWLSVRPSWRVARAELTGARLRIEQYPAQLAKLRRMQFGRSSEKLDAQIEQLERMLEDLEAGEAARTAAAVQRTPDQPRRERQPVRRPLPDHLPREEIVHHPGSVCPDCGGTRFSKIGEDVTEVLEKIPARLKVIRHIRPKLSCRSCERIVQAPVPDLPVEKGRPGPGLSPMWWSASISTGCRSTASRRSWRAKGSRSSARRWPIGSGMSPGG